MIEPVEFAYKNFQNMPAALLARVSSLDGYITQGSIASIEAVSYDIDDPGVVVKSVPLTPSEVIFDVLQTPWRRDSTGYNFRWNAPGSVSPKSNKTYRIEITFTPIDGDAIVIVFKPSTIALLSQPD